MYENFNKILSTQLFFVIPVTFCNNFLAHFLTPATLCENFSSNFVIIILKFLKIFCFSHFVINFLKKARKEYVKFSCHAL